ncbi:alpha-mannosidase [Jannaschia sp. Os4]|uniref:alpha-mannosidase n=1 Tax=Jannaschia sp. Os4 TaxID=2807617 RepID=UPI001939FA54|nr:glycoside hydrolase family 38 C-terminal domain-containing protein [Jannaschia sp. Os4]MBM2578020.1 alpha-mannosidase [Jannaschia sp. Os4]
MSDHARRFTAQKIAKRIALVEHMVHRQARPLDPFRWTALESEATPPPIGHDGEGWAPIEPHDHWAGQDVHYCMTTTFTVPAGWTKEDGPVALHLPMGVAGDIFTHPEGLLYLDGTPYASADRHHHTIHLPPEMADGRPHRVHVHGWTGLTGWPPDPESRDRLQMGECRVVEVHEPTRDFLTRAQVALELARTMDDARPERHAILAALDAAFLALDTRDPLGEAFWRSVPAAAAKLAEGLSRAGRPLDVDLHAIGHAHMDIAYLWPVGQMRLKNARTYSNVLRLMERFPEYRFSHSQPQLYAYTEADYPDIFAAIRERVAEGRWEVIGGMWVEPDTNLPGGEALVRQLLLGRSWYREKFGAAETPVLWLPDTFGLTWSLPQLVDKAGLRWMVVNKASWNQYNKLPASTLWWEGIDGTRVLTQFLTTPRGVQHLPYPTSYKSDLTAEEVVGTWEASTAKDHVRDLPIAYGYGDGGGGPTGELIRRARIWSDMAGAPRVRPSTVRACMEAIEGQAANVPVWADELYLEGHRGTLTSQAWIKRANRKAEIALHDVEFLLAATGRPNPPGLRRAWELLCLNQFHDILPGTSVPAVWEDSRRDYAEIDAICAEASDLALPGGGRSLVNTTPWDGPRLVDLPGAPVGEGMQATEGGALAYVDCAPHSITPIRPRPPEGRVAVARDGGGGVTLSNAHLEVVFDAQGQLVRLHDRDRDRAVLADGRVGNQLQAFEDRPLSWDAWDIDSFFEDRGEVVGGLTAMEVVEEGPLRARLRMERHYRASTIRQDVMIYADSRRVDFETEVDWQESHVLLKAAFPVDVFAPSAAYEIQWGAIERRTHRNTSWDYAKFEVPAQRWADLSEADYGVALLNDCKYGYDVKGNVLRVTLIKSATSPDPKADRGRHVFTYALLPHEGRWSDPAAPVLREAAFLNMAPAIVPGRGDGRAWVRSSRATVVVETIKPAEDGDGVIVRLFDACRTRGPVTLTFADAPASVHRCALLETEDMEPVTVEGASVTLDVAPFEIVTLRVRR